METGWELRQVENTRVYRWVPTGGATTSESRLSHASRLLLDGLAVFGVVLLILVLSGHFPWQLVVLGR